MPQPLHLCPALGELCFEPEALGERAVDVVLCLCLTHGSNRLLHGEVKTVTPRRPNIITFERRRTGENDVGTPCCWRPPRLVYDDGFGLLPGTQETVEILNLVERVATTPVDQPDVRIGQPVAVEIQGRTGIEQHVGEPCHRDIGLDRVNAGRQV